MSYTLDTPQEILLHRKVSPNKQYNWWQAHYGTLLAGQEVGHGFGGGVAGAAPVTDGNRVLWRQESAAGGSQVQLGPITSPDPSTGYITAIYNPVIEFCIIPRFLSANVSYSVGLHRWTGLQQSITLNTSNAAISLNAIKDSNWPGTSAASGVSATANVDLYARIVISPASVALWTGTSYENLTYRCQIDETPIPSLIPTLGMHGSVYAFGGGGDTAICDLWWMSTEQDI